MYLQREVTFVFSCHCDNFILCLGPQSMHGLLVLGNNTLWLLSFSKVAR